MKKRGIITLGAVLAVAVIAAVLVFCNPFGQRRKVAPITDLMVVYVDGGQLVQKGALDKFISEHNRSMMAMAALSGIENSEVTEYLNLVAKNFNETGISFEKPAYAYVNGDMQDDVDGVLVLEVYDVEKVDKFVEMLSKLQETEDMEPIDVKKVGDRRTFAYDEAFCGYDETRFIVAYSTMGDGEALANEAMNRPFSDLSVFGDRDLALYVDIDQIITIAEDNLNNTLAEYEMCMGECEYDYEVEWYEENIASVEESIAQLAEVRAQIGEKASVVSGLTFELGRAVLDFECDSSNDIDSKLFNKVDNSHLQYVSQDVIALLNMGINGEKVAEIVKENITPDFASMLDVNRNEFNFVLQLVCDALSSVDGDFTVALEGMDGTSRRRKVRLDSADLLMMADVRDRYIIDNVSQFAAGFLQKDGEDKYSAHLSSSFSLYVGQSDDVCYAGINSEFIPAELPAKDATWVNDIKDGYMYLLLDVENMMNSSYFKAYYDAAMRRMDYQQAETIAALVEESDYIYLKINDMYNSELVWVFDDKQTNALVKLVGNILPVIMDNMSL